MSKIVDFNRGNGYRSTYHEVRIGSDGNKGFEGACHGRGDEAHIK